MQHGLVDQEGVGMQSHDRGNVIHVQRVDRLETKNIVDPGDTHVVNGPSLGPCTTANQPAQASSRDRGRRTLAEAARHMTSFGPPKVIDRELRVTHCCGEHLPESMQNTTPLVL